MIKEALASYAQTSRRRWPHDRTKSIGASEIGQCARRTWFMKHNQQPDPDHHERWGATKRGDLIEAFWEKAIRHHFGVGHVHYAGRHQRTFFDDASPLSATPDALVHDPARGICFVLDCKSVDPRSSMNEAKPEHIMQLNTQIGLVSLKTRYKPTSGMLTYIDASFLDEVREFLHPYDPALFAHSRERARAIMEANSAEALKPEGYIAGGAECDYCPFRHACSAMRAGRVPGREGAVDDDDMATIARLAREREEMRSAADALTAKAKLSDEDIKQILQRCGTRRAEGQGVRVSWASLKGRPSWNMPALRQAAEAAGLDLGPFETTGDPSDRLTVTLAQARNKAA